MERGPLDRRKTNTEGGQGSYFTTGVCSRTGRDHPHPALLEGQDQVLIGCRVNFPEAFNLKFFHCISKSKTPFQKMHLKKIYIRIGCFGFGLQKKNFFKPKP